MRVLSLRSKLVLGALLLAAVPLCIAAWMLPRRVEAVLDAQGRSQLAQTARDLATLTDQVIRQHRDVVKSVASISSIATPVLAHNLAPLSPAELAALNRQLGAILGSLGEHYQGLWTASSAGIIFAGTLKGGDTSAYVHLDVHDRAYFVDARRTLQPVISEPMISKVGNVPIVVITVPLQDSAGAFAGLVGLSVEVDYLARIISTQKLGTTGYPFAIDRHGIMFAHPDPARVMKLDFTKVAGAEHVARRMLAGEVGLQDYVSSKGEEKLAAFAPVSVTGWSVAASQETVEFTQPVRRLRLFFQGLIGLCLGGAAVASFAFARSLAAPVRHVSAVLDEAAAVLDSGTEDIANGANTLASAASEQAAGIEQTSASLTELTATTRSNSDRATEAARLVQISTDRMHGAGTRMRDLDQAVRSAAEASEQTRKVIKTIDEIAFQTNILALNAAVEAARAGEAGMGFAVVADEVRSLAGRAADAARESAETLQRVGDLVQRSRELAGTTSQEFAAVQADNRKTGALMGEIAGASREQSAALEQINRSLSQFEQGIQTTAAHAEQAAAAAQELRAQAVTIRHEIRTLDSLVEGAVRPTAVCPMTPPPAPVSDPAPRAALPPPTRTSSKLPEPALT